LAFHDGVTGLRQSSLDVGFPVSYPDWSPDGQTIAVTHIYGKTSTMSFKEGGISVIQQSATGWSPSPAEEVVVPHTALKNRYTPTFVPDSSFLIYSEATQQTGDSDGLVNAYSPILRPRSGPSNPKPRPRPCCWPARTRPAWLTSSPWPTDAAPSWSSGSPAEC
jgi:hypothetical protein